MATQGAQLGELLGLKTYAARASALHAWGAERGDSLVSSDEFAALKGGGTFEALAALLAAKGAGVDSTWACEHPSARVRHVLLKDKLISLESAERLLLSPDTSADMRSRLIESGLVPVTKDTLRAAAELDGAVRGSESAEWSLLQRGVTSGDISAPRFYEMVTSIAKRRSMRGSEAQLSLNAKTASRHAKAIIWVLERARETEEPLPFRWNESWLTIVAVQDPCAPVLRGMCTRAPHSTACAAAARVSH